MFRFTTTDGNEYKVNFSYTKYDGKPFETLAVAYDSNNKQIDYDSAVCNENDNFQYTIGRKLALTRLFKSMRLDRENRSIAWNAYFSKCKR